VSFSGYVSPSSTVFDRSDIALSLSTRDALGNVVVEAQLAERPVVAAGVGGHLESIMDGVTGLHVLPGDAESVADAVETLLADPGRAREMAMAGRTSATTLFGARRYAEQVVGVVVELAAGRPGP
jgi:glycosyltransferase involved in cell wall biosynthesis